MANQQLLAPKKARLRLGELLTAGGFITEEQLDEALAEGKRTGERLGQVLLRHKVISEVVLVRNLAQHYDIEFVDLDEMVLDTTACHRVTQMFAQKREILPVAWRGDLLVVATPNPSDVFVLDDVRSITGCEVHAVMAERHQLLTTIERVWSGGGDAEAMIRSASEEADTGREEETGLEHIREAAEDAPIVQFVNHLVTRAIGERASDIHLEASEQEIRIRFRIDGVLRQVMQAPRSMQNSVDSRIKIMADIDISERRLPQDGRMSVRLAGRTVNLRVVTLPTAHGESVVLRILDTEEGVRRVSELGFLPPVLETYESAYTRPWGAIVVTGPTGSGKSTTLHATLAELNHPDRSIITVEDPVEVRVAGVKQMQVNRKTGLTFANALRSILRADPDVVLVGEIRDEETARITVEAAMTGHLVLTSLHTNDAASTPLRLVEMGIEPFLVTSAIECVLAQRLARRLCDRCKAADAMPVEALRDAGFTEADLDQGRPQLFRPVGCDHCGQTGYRGRFAVHEVLRMSEAISHLIMTRSRTDEIADQARREGMLTLRRDGLLKAAMGQTSLEELARVVT